MSSGTNKERLTQNNAKIEELIELVKTKASGEGSEQLTNFSEYEVPVNNGLNMKHFVLSTGDVLFSGSNNELGIWLFELSSRNITKIYDEGKWTTFKLINDNICLISSTHSSTLGILSYNMETKDIIKIYEADYYWNTFLIIDETCLITSSQSYATGVLLYDTISNTISQAYSEGARWSKLVEIEDGALIGGATSSGLLNYNKNTKLITTLIDSSTWSTYKESTNGIIWLGTSESYIFNKVDKSLSLVSNLTSSWSTIKEVGSDFIFSRTSSSYPGAFIYSDSNLAIYKITDVGYYWNRAIEFDDEYIIAGTSSLIYRIDKSTCVATPITTTVSSSTNALFKLGDECVINVSGQGIWLYDSLTKSASNIYNDGFSWNNIMKANNNKCLLSSATSNTGLLLYDSSTKSCKKVYSLGEDWGGTPSQDFGDSTQMGEYSIVIDDTTLVGGKGMLLYDDSNETVQNIYNFGDNFRYFFPLSDGCLVSTNSNSFEGLIKYNSIDKSFKKVIISGSGYYKELKESNLTTILLGSSFAYNTSNGDVYHCSYNSKILNDYLLGNYIIVDLRSGTSKHVSADCSAFIMGNYAYLFYQNNLILVDCSRD